MGSAPPHPHQRSQLADDCVCHQSESKPAHGMRVVGKPEDWRDGGVDPVLRSQLGALKDGSPLCLCVMVISCISY